MNNKFILKVLQIHLFLLLVSVLNCTPKYLIRKVEKRKSLKTINLKIALVGFNPYTSIKNGEKNIITFDYNNNFKKLMSYGIPIEDIPENSEYDVALSDKKNFINNYFKIIGKPGLKEINKVFKIVWKNRNKHEIDYSSTKVRNKGVDNYLVVVHSPYLLKQSSGAYLLSSLNMLPFFASFGLIPQYFYYNSTTFVHLYDSKLKLIKFWKYKNSFKVRYAIWQTVPKKERYYHHPDSSIIPPSAIWTADIIQLNNELPNKIIK